MKRGEERKRMKRDEGKGNDEEIIEEGGCERRAGNKKEEKG